MIDHYSIKVGDVITPETGLELCRHFGFDYLVERLEGNLDKYKSFVFDGVSGLPENLAALLVGVNERALTYKCALPHDLQFAYSQKGNKKEEAMANSDFYNNLINISVVPWKAWAALKIVEKGGAEELDLSFSFGFANKEI